MAQRLPKRSSLLAKIESTYATDPVPVVATDAMYVYNLKIDPISVVVHERKPVRNFFGADPAAVGGSPVKVSFEVPVAGGGAAGTAPGYAVLLKACGRAETINPGVSALYSLISSGFQSVTLYLNRDGVLHKVTGFRGDVSLEMSHEGVPMYKFNGIGIYNAPTDTALANLTFGGTWVKPVLMNKVNTTFTIHGISAKVSKFSYGQGNSVVWKDYVNNAEEVRINDRAAPLKGSITLEADSVANADWLTKVKTGATGAIAVTHGTVAGNKWQHASSIVRPTDVAEEDDSGTLMYKIGLEFYPSSAGNDEFTETVL